MKKKDADEVKKYLTVGENVQAEMTWSLPAPDDRVEWSLWTSAMDTTAAVRGIRIKHGQWGVGAGGAKIPPSSS